MLEILLEFRSEGSFFFTCSKGYGLPSSLAYNGGGVAELESTYYFGGRQLEMIRVVPFIHTKKLIFPNITYYYICVPKYCPLAEKKKSLLRRR